MSEYAPCPKCQVADAVAPVSFTWWGGVLGPKLLNHVKCGRCGTAYNGKTGADNTNGIIIYTIVTLAIAIGVLILLRKM
jgi:hypothetical protein